MKLWRLSPREHVYLRDRATGHFIAELVQRIHDKRQHRIESGVFEEITNIHSWALEETIEGALIVFDEYLALDLVIKRNITLPEDWSQL